MRFEDKKGVRVIRLDGELDLEAYNALRDPLYQMLEVPGARVLIDLAHVQYISTLGWGLLLSCLKRSLETNTQLKLLNLSPNLAATFVLFRFERVFELYDNEEFALRSFAPFPNSPE